VCKYGLLYLVAFAIPVLCVQLRFVNCINKRKKKKEVPEVAFGTCRIRVQLRLALCRAISASTELIAVIAFCRPNFFTAPLSSCKGHRLIYS